MQNMIFFIPIEDLDEFIGKANEMGVQILSHNAFPEQQLVQVDILAEDFTGVYVLGNVIGYGRAYREATVAMNQALSQLNNLKFKFDELQRLKSELENIQKPQ